MKKKKFLAEASFEILAVSKEEAEKILEEFLARYINMRPVPFEISTGEINKEFNVNDSTFILDDNDDYDEFDEETED